MWVCVNHARKWYRAHRSKKKALLQALRLRQAGEYATVWSLEQAREMGQINGMPELLA